jgi:hypothetical protein
MGSGLRLHQKFRDWIIDQAIATSDQLELIESESQKTVEKPASVPGKPIAPIENDRRKLQP